LPEMFSMFPILILDEHSTNLVKNYDSIILPGNDLLTPYNLIKIELMSTYTNLTKLLKKKMRKIKPLRSKVVNEANKLGINIEPA